MGGGGSEAGYTRITSCSAEECALALENAERVVFVPGYGLAVAQAQHALRELAKVLEANGTEVSYAIHPVAGRMPGHMNVLLAEADVPYEQLHEMDAINPEFPRTDVAIVLGANDVVNPDAKTDPTSPLYGMPVLEVDQARQVFVVKRSLGAGYAGIANGLFELPQTAMVFGDAKVVLNGLLLGAAGAGGGAAEGGLLRRWTLQVGGSGKGSMTSQACQQRALLRRPRPNPWASQRRPRPWPMRRPARPPA